MSHSITGEREIRDSIILQIENPAPVIYKLLYDYIYKEFEILYFETIYSE